MSEGGSSFVTDEEEELETVSSSVEIVKPPAPASKVAVVAAAPKAKKEDSSDLSSLSSSEDKPKTGGTRSGKARAAGGGSSSVSLSESGEEPQRTPAAVVRQTAPAAAPPAKPVSVHQSSEEEGELKEEEEEGEEETSEKISSVESSEHQALKSPIRKPVVKTGSPREAAPPKKGGSPRVVMAAQPAAEVASKCGPLKYPLEGPVEVDIEDLVRLCRCGQSDKFPYCDGACEAYNAANGTKYGFWSVDPIVMGSTLFVCGCGKSARRELGLPLCDYACRPDENAPVKVTAAAKAPTWVDEPVAVAREPTREPAKQPEPVLVREPAKQPEPVEHEAVKPAAVIEPPRPTSVVVRVVDKMRDGDSVASADGDEDEEGEEFSSEEDSGHSVRTGPQLPVSVVAAKPQPEAVAAEERERQRAEEEKVARAAAAAERTRQQEEALAAEAAAAKRAEDAVKAARAARERAEEEEETERRKLAEVEQRRQRLAEESRAADRAAAVAAASAASDAKARKAAAFAEQLRQQEAEVAARRERILAEEAQEQQRQLRERDARAAQARKQAVAAAAATRPPKEKQPVTTVVAREVNGGIDPKAEVDRRAPLYRSRPDPIVDNDLFDSSEEPIYLAWEDGAEQRSRALGLAAPAGPETLYVSHWDPASASVRFLVAKKSLPVRVVASLPPGVPETTHALDVFPLLVLPDGAQVRGCGAILDYLVEKYRGSEGPRFVGRSPEVRVASGIISNVCDTFLGPMLYLYPSHTVMALAGRPPVPMRSADKEKVFRDHLAQLDLVEGYASRQGPYLTGKTPAVCDAHLLPLCVYYATYCHRLGKVLFDGRPKLRAWYEAMLEDPVVQTIVNDVNKAVLQQVNHGRSHRHGGAAKKK